MTDNQPQIRRVIPEQFDYLVGLVVWTFGCRVALAYAGIDTKRDEGDGYDQLKPQDVSSLGTDRCS